MLDKSSVRDRKLEERRISVAISLASCAGRVLQHSYVSRECHIMLLWKTHTSETIEKCLRCRDRGDSARFVNAAKNDLIPGTV